MTTCHSVVDLGIYKGGFPKQKPLPFPVNVPPICYGCVKMANRVIYACIILVSVRCVPVTIERESFFFSIIKATVTRRHFHLKTHTFLCVCTSRLHGNSENTCSFVFILKTHLKAEAFENDQTETTTNLM